MKLFSHFTKNSASQTQTVAPPDQGNDDATKTKSRNMMFASKAVSARGEQNQERRKSNSFIEEARLTSNDFVQAKKNPGREALAGPSSNQTPRRRKQTSEMVKRRVKAPVAIFDRPLMTEVEFIIDARYHAVKVIGSGSFGVVACAIDSTTGHRIAIKKILSTFSSTRSARYVLREVRLLRHLKHPNIVKLLDIDVPYQYRSWDEVYIITSLLRTDLRSALNDGLINTLKQKKKIGFDLLFALEHMHSLGLMHRDVKSRNLLLNNDLDNAELCDLGHSRFYSKSNKEFDLEFDAALKATDEPDLSGSVTTMIQSAPEISLNSDYDMKVDVWSAGCVIAELIHPENETLFDSTGKNSHLMEIFDVTGYPTDEEVKFLPDHAKWFIRLKSGRANSRDAAGNRSKLKQKLCITDEDGNKDSANVLDLLSRMLQFSPSNRLSAKEALDHAWFDDVRQERVVPVEPYDFGTSEPPRKASKAELKELVWKEMVAFHPEAPQLCIR